MTPSKIIIHHSACQDGPENNTAAIRRWHMGTPPNGPADGPYRDVAYSALCEKVGDTYEILMGRPWDWNGAHTIGQNDKSLGICFVGNYDIAAPPDEMLVVGAKMIAYWCRAFAIPTTEIYRHSAWNQTACPGAKFPMGKLIELVKASA